jgi:ubiquinone/menaquinone biosynthesis C-methylase UbiE
MNVEAGSSQAEFDAVADDYELQHAASIRLSGEATSFFARYKVEDVRKALEQNATQAPTILDFGAGIGNSSEYFLELFPDSKIICADVSSRSLQLCKERGGSSVETVQIIDNKVDLDDNSVDLIFVACVFHHIVHDEHHAVLQEMRRLLRPGGRLFVFEHNPWNPATRYAVAKCPFDEGAVLIDAPEMKRRIESAGFSQVKTEYRIFFPGAAAKLRWIEKYLTSLPIGAQYSLHARA